MAEEGSSQPSAGRAPANGVVRLAVWSGPRNISTAMMRSWENRTDSLVVDEPFYAYYLATTGVDHPGCEEVVATGETDWRPIVDALLGSVPDETRVFYSKQMIHHLVGAVAHDWIHRLTNVLLIRDPQQVVASYLRSRPTVEAADIGIDMLASLYDELSAAGAPPPVIDTADFLADPEGYSRALCGFVGLPFQRRMLHWPPGPRPTDGSWGPYWYDAVWRSTGFEPYRPKAVELSGAAAAVAEEAQPSYERLHAVRWLLS